MAGMRSLNVIPGTAVIPYEPAGVRGDAPGRAHQLRRVRSEQDVAARGHARQDGLERPPVAGVVFH